MTSGSSEFGESSGSPDIGWTSEGHHQICKICIGGISPGHHEDIGHRKGIARNISRGRDVIGSNGQQNGIVCHSVSRYFFRWDLYSVRCCFNRTPA